MSNGYDYDLLALGGAMAGLPVAMKCAYSGKETALGETEGFVKLVTDADTDELLGVHVVGEQDAELVLAIELGSTAEQIAETMHIHPTLPESINSAAGGVHKPS